MRSIIRFILLAFPLLWFAANWCSLVFGMNLNFLDFNEDNVMLGNLVFCWWFVGVPVSLVSALIYTFKRKYWIWFIAYMVLGGIPVFGYALAVMLSPYFR
ncbi:hypothetical protein WAX88_01325 [Photobacterium damselae subsp. damselae]|uniref:hypothetical protein n=1 Tax=Photobacterium damselae TaxID=38293 RepID=UPI00311ACCBF